MFNLRRIDLNLLTVFEVVYEEKNQRKASERLFLTQPAVSVAISRLRDIVSDRLFTSTRNGLIATPKADELYQVVHPALGLIRSKFESVENFDPSSCRRTFRICIDYGSGAAIALPLFQRIREKAPNAKLQLVNHLGELSSVEKLREGELDVVSSQYRFTDPAVEAVPINWHTGVLILRQEHPRIRSLPSIEDLISEEFVLVHGQPTTYENADMDTLFACIRDRVVLEVPSAAVIPAIVRKSELVSLVSKQVIEALDEPHGLQVYDIPFEYTPAPAFVHWKNDISNDPAAQWFKDEVLELIRQLSKVSSQAL